MKGRDKCAGKTQGDCMSCSYKNTDLQALQSLMNESCPIYVNVSSTTLLLTFIFDS